MLRSELLPAHTFSNSRSFCSASRIQIFRYCNLDCYVLIASHFRIFHRDDSFSLSRRIFVPRLPFPLRLTPKHPRTASALSFLRQTLPSYTEQKLCRINIGAFPFAAPCSHIAQNESPVLSAVHPWHSHAPRRDTLTRINPRRNMNLQTLRNALTIPDL